MRTINSGFFFHPRSFSKPQTKSSQSVCERPQNVYEKLKCATCGQYVMTGEEKKIQNQKRAKSRKPLVILPMMSTRKLQTWTSFLAADLCRHKNYMNYNGKWNRATPNTSARTTSKAKRDIFKIYFPFMKSIVDQARFSLSGIKNMINQNDDIDLKKKKKEKKQKTN